MPAKKTDTKKVTKAKPATKPKAKAATKVAAKPKGKVAAKPKAAPTPKPTNGKVAAFTLDDVKSLLKTKKPEESDNGVKEEVKVVKKKAKIELEDVPHETQSLGAASLADILGYSIGAKPKQNDKTKIPKKFKVYYDLLNDLRNHVNDELNLHTRETLKSSGAGGSGETAGYDKGTINEAKDDFDPDFALGLVSNEQETLSEIEEAINRIFDGTYGMCEITGDPISAERLLAVPFTKHSLEGQKKLEKNHRFSVQRGGVYSTGIEGSSEFAVNDDGD
jgi:RNA polymerase-binding transcription factor DksA